MFVFVSPDGGQPGLRYAIDLDPTATPPPPTNPPALNRSRLSLQPSLGSGAITSLEDLRKAVVQIEATGTFVEPQGTVVNGEWGGSGFLIDPSGLAVTNNHVVTGAATLKSNRQRETYRARVLGVSEYALIWRSFNWKAATSPT